jgi:hypothetical protein
VKLTAEQETIMREIRDYNAVLHRLGGNYYAQTVILKGFLEALLRMQKELLRSSTT